jgi:hypothetical protein
MQAYATSERLPLADELRSLDRTSARTAATSGDSNPALIAHLGPDRRPGRRSTDRAHGRAEQRSRERLVGCSRRGGAPRRPSRHAAQTRRTASHPHAPGRAGCKLYFRRDELDEWRRSARPMPSAAALRAVS